MDEIENQKELTEKMKNIYLQETKMDAEFLEELLARELWLPSERCLELGLVDAIQ